jgi:GntR family transcriptional regulator, vanillate catabolism transcriptional regulator
MLNEDQGLDGKETQASRIINSLREKILDGTFPSEAKLREVELATTFGASRTPIRTALEALAGEGLLKYQSNRGFRVRKFSIQDIIDAYETRANLEGMACRIMAQRGMSKRDLRTLEESIRQIDEILDSGELDKSKIDRRYHLLSVFHDTIVKATRNEYLIGAVEMTRKVPFLSEDPAGPHYKREVNMVLRKYVTLEQLRMAYHDERRIVEAIKMRQPTRAEFLMHELLGWACEQYLEKMKMLNLATTSKK